MGFRRKKSQISRAQAHILWCWVPPKKIFSAEILGKRVESAEVHYTKPEDEFRRTIGLNTKFRREFFSAEVRYTISVVEFRRKQKNKVRKKKCNRFGGTGSQFYLNFLPFFFSRSQTPPCPIIGRNGKKVHKVRRDLFGKLIWDFIAKFGALGPTLLIGHGWHMWSGGTCLGNPWKIV